MSWPMVKLGDVCEINIGKTPSRSNSKYWGNGHRWLSIADMNQGKWISNTKEQITNVAIKESGIKKVPANTVLFSFKLSIGKVCLSETDIYTNEAIAALPIKKESQLDSIYLSHILKSIVFSDMTDNAVMGATLNKKKLAELRIPLPSIEKQKRIAAILDKADGIRQKREQAIKLADDFLRANFLKLFGDPISNPKNWELRKLGEIADCQLGKMLSKKSKTGLSPKKYLRNANIRWRKIDVSDLLEMDFNEKELSKFELKQGDLLVCEGGEIGRCAIWDNQIQDCYYQKALHRVRPDYNVLTSVYLQEYFYSMAKGNAFSEIVSEVTFSHLTAEKLKNLLIPIPEISIQRKFEMIYNKLNTLIYDKYSDEISLTLLSNAINKKLINHL